MDFSLWKEKDELKKFMENLGIEYRYGCIEQKDPAVCHLLGDYLLTISKDISLAGQVYQSNCDDREYGLSCDAFGRMNIRGDGEMKKDFAKALEYFLKGCDFNEPRSCYHGGQLLTMKDKKLNSEVQPDEPRGLKMLEKGCLNFQNPPSCLLAHNAYLRGIDGVKKDMLKASQFAQIACHLNEHAACFNLARMYHLGDGVEADQEKYKYFLKRTKQIVSGSKQIFEARNASSDLSS